jgi:hypothetical protein
MMLSTREVTQALGAAQVGPLEAERVDQRVQESREGAGPGGRVATTDLRMQAVLHLSLDRHANSVPAGRDEFDSCVWPGGRTTGTDSTPRTGLANGPDGRGDLWRVLAVRADGRRRNPADAGR